MPTNEPTDAAVAEPASNQILDIEKLHSLPSERQDLVLLTFVSDLARHVAGIEEEELNERQKDFKAELLKVVKLSSPSPTRVIRNNLGQCLHQIFSRGNRKILFETINELIAVITNGGRNEKDLRAKHAAVHCLGVVYETAGDSAISLHSNSLLVLQKQLKSAPNHAGLRAAILRATGRLFKGVGRSVDELLARDSWKQIRPLVASEKAHLVQLYACWTVQQIFEHTTHLDNSNDFDKLQTAIWRATDSPSAGVRRAAASCLSAVYVKHYSDSPSQIMIKKKSKKPKPLDADGDDVSPGLDRTDSSALQRPALSLSFGLLDILKQLSQQYCRATSDRTRASIAQAYIRVTRSLPDDVLETSYPLIARHLFTDLLNAPSIINIRYRLLITRKYVHMILAKVIGLQIFGESSQIDAVRFLVNGILKDYPQSDIKERPEPSKETLIGALSVLSTILNALGSACSVVADSCRAGLLQVLEHPSFSVQVHASTALKALVLACPSQLLPCATICMNSVAREVALLANHRRSPRRCMGFALGLSASISTAASQPLYGDVDVYARIMSQAMSILKSSGSSDLRISSIQIQVAYTMISGLMSLGPSFVKIHLAQLLLVWKNALPKLIPGENTKQRGLREFSFLAHLRECALSSILAFLKFNGKLLTLDVSRRLAGMLENTTSFINSLPAKQTTEDTGNLLSSSIQLKDYNLMLKRRIFECYTALLKSSTVFAEENLLQTGLLSLAGASFADSDNSSASSLSSSIAASSGNFERIWDVGDNSGFGITSLINGLEIQWMDARRTHWLSQYDIQSDIERIVNAPTCTSPEYDSILLYAGEPTDTAQPVSTAVVDASIRLFATALPLQSSRIQEGAIEQISTLVFQSVAQKNPAREVAITINAATAILFFLQVANKETAFSSGSVRSPAVQRAVQELLEYFLSHHETAVRNLASESIGRLCRLGGHDVTTKIVQAAIDRIVKDRDPIVRSGCAMALGCIASSLGGMAAGLHFKDILGVLNSLASDPHPTVHFWALDGISKIAESAGLSFSSYVTGALGMIGGLYISETHGEECSLAVSSNMELETPSLAVLARCTNAMINVLGPDLQDLSKPRNLVLTLTYQFQTEDSPLSSVESLKCLQNLTLYASGHISFKPYIKQLQSKLSSMNPDVRETALAGLHNAMRRGAEEVLAAEATLEELLWQTLNSAYGQGLSRSIVQDWAEQSGLALIPKWIERIAHVFSSVKAPKKKAVIEDRSKPAPVHEAQDEEVAGFAAAVSETTKDQSNEATDASQELLRWQTRCFALEVLNDILTAAKKSSLTDDGSPAIGLLQPRVADIVKIAFSASTASVVELRIQGIRIIGQILQIFGRIPDPDFPDATMLEQYQAQISSALTPAFANDSSPILAAEAVHVCGSFVSTGIVTDKDRMGRILRLLVSALDDFSKNAEAVSIGDLKGLSANAQVMVRLAVFSAWADLQVASQDQKYLEDVVQPHAAKLTPLWLSSLREYARLKFEPEISMAGVVSTGGVDEVYAALNREILLEFYQASWLNFVNAIASLIENDADFVFDALDGKEEGDQANGESSPKSTEISYRDEPVAFFFVLFGISFEALVAKSAEDEISAQQKRLDILQAMKRILQPSIAGASIYQDAIFTEAMDLLDRLALIEGLEIQIAIVEIAQRLCIEHPSARRNKEQLGATDSELSEDIDQLFELTRIIVLVLTQYIPALSIDKTTRASRPNEEVTALIVMALTALVSSAEVFPSIIKSDLHSCIMHVFAAIFSTPASQSEVVPRSLPVFKRFITGLATTPQPDTSSQVRNALARFLGLIRSAQSREAEAAVQCEKNTLLAAAILVSTSAAFFDRNDPLIERFIDTILDCMGNLLTTKVAAGVARSLLTLPASVGPRASSIINNLLPKLIAFLLLPAETDGLDDTKPIVSQALTAFALSSPSFTKQSSFDTIIVTLLGRADREGEKVWREIASRLMEMASKEPMSFRSTIARIPAAQRSVVQQVLQHSGIANRQQSSGDERDAATKEPTIALKMDF